MSLKSIPRERHKKIFPSLGKVLSGWDRMLYNTWQAVHWRAGHAQDADESSKKAKESEVPELQAVWDPDVCFDFPQWSILEQCCSSTHLWWQKSSPNTCSYISMCLLPLPPAPQKKKNSCIQAGRHHPPAVAQGPGRSPASGNSSCLTRLEQIQILDRLNISLNIGTLSFPSAFCL